MFIEFLHISFKKIESKFSSKGRFRKLFIKFLCISFKKIEKTLHKQHFIKMNQQGKKWKMVYFYLQRFESK